MTATAQDDSHLLLEQDARARYLIRTALDETVIVEAAAGTGKTTALVERIVSVLRAGLATVEQIVAVTFTHKAAGELKVRLRQKLDDERQSAQGQELLYLEDALKRLEEAAIGTIHSFCTQILRERPVEARVDPKFEEVPEQEQRRLYKRSFQNWFEQALEQSRIGVRRVLTRLAWNSTNSPIEELEAAGWKLIEWRDFDCPWRCEPFDRIGSIDELSELVHRISGLSRRCQKPSDELYRALAPVRELDAWLERTDQQIDYETLEALLIKLLKDLNRDKRKGRGSFAEDVAREDVQLLRHTLLDQLETFKERADADLASVLHTEMRDLIDAYEELKNAAGKLDFVDLLLKTRNLIRDNAAVRSFLRSRFSRIFVDEFQDTDPLQAEILMLLAGSDNAENDHLTIKPVAGKLFIVGDPKQSIYRFRRADIAMYQNLCDKLVASGARIVHLARSFRAAQPIQECVNAAFASEMQENRATAQTGYVPLLGGESQIQGQPSIVALPAPISWTGQPTTKKEVNECLPDGICSFIEWLIRESGWKIRDPDGGTGLVPIRARHIAVLFKRVLYNREDMARPYIRSLEARDIPHLLVASKSFHQREEVETLRAVCTAIEWPDDELAVYAVLRGSLFSIPDNLLLRYRFELKTHLHPLGLRDDGLPENFKPISRALNLLADAHRNRNRRPIAGTIQNVLEATRAYMGFALRPGGHQVLANVYRVIEIARSFEQNGGISFRAFVEDLTARAESYDASEAPMIEESADGVRLLTVHNAKGLEFPVVILADMTANIAAQEPDRYIDTRQNLCATRLVQYAPFEWLKPQDLIDHAAQENARDVSEGVRVAYVAATRARDLLVVPALGIGRMSGWLTPLTKAIHPNTREYRTSRTATGCPAFGKSTLLAGPDDETICPGAHRPEAGSHEVVWWDPSLLRLDVDAKQGLRTIELLQGDANSSTRAYQTWCELSEQSIALGVKPTREVLSPSGMREAPTADVIAVHHESIRGSSPRPTGSRFGTLVHSALRDHVWDEQAVSKIVQNYGRILGATEEEIEAAQQVIENTLSHPLLKRARLASRCHREFPVILHLDNSRTLEGVIDLAFLESGMWHVVDFKTDEDKPSLSAHYERQIRWYGHAISRLTALPISCHLLFI
jgi:ATP-dependent exoDNAse (exonuclease V) beta subunit